MINATNTVHVDGKVLNSEEYIKQFTFGPDDKFGRWVVRPLALLTAIGMAVAMFFASAFVLLLSLAMLPLVAVSVWALKTKFERDIAKADPVVDTQESSSENPATHAQTDD